MLINFIPSKYHDGFKQLGEISNEIFDEIKEYLSNSPRKSSIDKLTAGFSSNSDFDVEEIFSSVGSIIPVLENEDELPELVNNIVSLAELNDLIKKKDRKKLKDRLLILLNDQNIFYASKAEDLIDNYGNKFILSRVISDIRLVFPINLDSTLENGMIIHNLTIHYQSNEEPFHKNITLTLTSEDLSSLKETLSRAEKKEVNLKSVFKKAHIKNIEQ